MLAKPPADALARIFLDQLLDHQQRLAVARRAASAAPLSLAAAGCGCAAVGLAFRQQVAQRHARPRRRAHQLARVGVRRAPRRCVLDVRRLDHVALLHHHHAVAIGGGEAEVVGDQDGRHAALARQLDDQVHHRLLRGDVEAGGRLVGDQQLRPAGQRQRDDDALAHAARQLEGIGVVALLGPGDAHLLEDVDGLLGRRRRSRPARAGAARPRSGGRPCGSGLSAARGFWKIIEISRPRRLRISPRRRSRTSMPVKLHRALGDAAGAVEDAHDRIGGDRLARARIRRRCRASRPWRR